MMELTALKDLNMKMPKGDFYKFTNLPAFFKELSPLQGVSPSSHLEGLPTIVFKDGRPEIKDPGLKSIKLEALKQGIAAGRAHPLRDIKGANAGGLEITVEKNAILDRPLRIVYQNSGKEFAAPSLLIRALENSRITVIEEVQGMIGAMTAETKVIVSAGAKVEHLQISDTAEGSVFHGATAAEVSRDAIYRNFIFHLGGKLNRRNLDLLLMEPGSHGESFNLFFTNQKEHSDINTVIEHKAPDSTSDQLAKGILDNESRAVFTGKIHIHPQAQRVASGQLNKNLLLSKKAQVHSQPQLEIFADDVKCSHGSTTGQISPEEMFYFQARGIPARKARTLLAHGFGLEVVLKIENSETREKIQSLILEKLQTKFHLGNVE